jgi:DNA-binding transcriptional LysR family regulator
MRAKNIKATDLNLLLALDVLLEERNVTRAAARMGLTQSAMSRVLARLRSTLGDPLFVRTSRGLTPTRRALEISAPLRDGLSRLEAVVLHAGGFDPSTARRRFRVAAVDYMQALLIAPFTASLQSSAPGIDFEIRQPSIRSEQELDTGDLDLLLLPKQHAAPGVVWAPLYEETYVCVVWQDSDTRRLTTAAYAAMEHVLVAPRETDGGIVDSVLEKEGLRRRVAVQASTFLLLPWLLEGTTRVATIPASMAEELVRVYPLRKLAPPLPVPGFTMCQGWHEIHRNDPGHRWLRDALAEGAAKRFGKRRAGGAH